MKSVWSKISVVLFALLATALVYLAFRPKPVEVETAMVARGLFTAVVEEDGRTRVRNRYLVSAPLAGRVLRIDLKPGDEIKAGSRVATLLPSLPPLLEARTRQELQERLGAADASLSEATARFERARAQEDQARRDVERVRTLQQRGAATNQQLEREELLLRLAERDQAAADLRRHATEHDVDQAKALLRRYEQSDNTDSWDVTSPIDGRVLRIIQESEASVVSGAPLVEIGDPRDLEVVADVLTSEAVDIKAGAPVAIERWGGPSALRGSVRLVEPAAFTKLSALGVEEQRVWVVVDLLSPREEWLGLGDNFRADVRITIAEVPDALLVPSGALFRKGDGWRAFVVRNESAHEQEVHVLRRTGRTAAVRDGLMVGDRVVLYPPGSLSEGAAVITRPK